MSPNLAKKNATSTSSMLILYAELNSAEKRAVQRKLKAGQIKLIRPGIATEAAEHAWPALVSRERIRILSALFPNSIFSFRTAFNGGLPENGKLYLTSSYDRKIQLPGLQIILLKGAPPLEGDMPIQGRSLHFASEPRCLLENLQPSRGSNKKSTGQEAVEKRLIEICDARGESALSKVREHAHSISEILGMTKEFQTLDALVGSILRTRKSSLQTSAGRAKTALNPYDPDRMHLFENFAANLRVHPFRTRTDPALSPQALINFAFLESYFSNFIEGTEFEIEEAREIVISNKPIATRPKDSHDILGVFRQAVTPAWTHQILAYGEPIESQLRIRHYDQMQERPEVEPGQFKLKSNRAGNTEFVNPLLVRGTLIEGSRLLPTVPAGLARALYAMFLIAEVHPFNDGNGRLARLVMNSELSVVGAARIIIPTLFREEYLDCLRLLSREGDSLPFISAMQKIQHWSADFDYKDLDTVIRHMKTCNAFERSLTQYSLLPAPSKD